MLLLVKPLGALVSLSVSYMRAYVKAVRGLELLRGMIALAFSLNYQLSYFTQISCLLKKLLSVNR